MSDTRHIVPDNTAGETILHPGPQVALPEAWQSGRPEPKRHLLVQENEHSERKVGCPRPPGQEAAEVRLEPRPLVILHTSLMNLGTQVEPQKMPPQPT